MQRASLLYAYLPTLPGRQSNVGCMLAAIPSTHQQRGTQPGPPGCSNLGLEGLRIKPLDPLEMAMRVVLQQLLEYSARPLPQAAWAGA